MELEFIQIFHDRLSRMYQKYMAQKNNLIYNLSINNLFRYDNHLFTVVRQISQTTLDKKSQYLHLSLQTSVRLQKGLHHISRDTEVRGQLLNLCDHPRVASVQELIPKKPVLPPVFHSVFWDGTVNKVNSKQQ